MPPRASLDIVRAEAGLDIPPDCATGNVGRIVFTILDATQPFNIQWDEDFTALYDAHYNDLDPSFTWVISGELQPALDIYVPSTTQTSSYSQLIIPVSAGQDVSGMEIYSFAATLTFDAALLTPNAVETAGTLSEGWTITANLTQPGQIRVVGYSATPLAGSGVLVNLAFDAGAPGSTALAFAEFRFNEGQPPAITHDGTVTVIQGDIAVSGQVTYYQNDSAVSDVAITFVGTSNFAVQTDANGIYNATLLYGGDYTASPAKSGEVNDTISALDAALAAQSDADIATLSAEQLRACDVSGNGICTAYDAAFILRYLIGVPGLQGGEWRFDPASRSYNTVAGGYSSENYTAYLMGDITASWPASGNRRQQAVAAPPLSLPTLSAQPGANILLPIAIGDASGQNILGFEGRLTFDPAVLQPVGATLVSEDSLSAGWVMTCTLPENGVLRFAAYGLEPLPAAGTLLNLRFAVNPATAHTTDLAAMMRLNETEWQSIAGQVMVEGGARKVYLPLVIR